MANDTSRESEKVVSFTEIRVATAKTDTAVIFSAISDLMVMVTQSNVAIRMILSNSTLPPEIRSDLDATSREGTNRISSMIEALDKWRGRDD